MQSYRRSSCAGWTTVIRCCLASLIANSSDYKPSSTLQRDGVRSSSLGPHHTSLSTATLAPGQAARGIQTGHSDVYKAVHGLLLSYLSGDCQLGSGSAAGRHQLRSSDIPTLVVHRTSTRLGDRCFRCAAARIWNRLPSSLRDPEVTYRQFCRQLTGP